MRTRRTIPLTLLAISFIVFLPVIIPVGLSAVAISNHRKRRAAASFRCTTCGQVLGPESIRIADEEFRKRMEELRKSHPFTKFRIVRTCHAICVTCGARYTFQEKERTFVSEPPPARIAE